MIPKEKLKAANDVLDKFFENELAIHAHSLISYISTKGLETYKPNYLRTHYGSKDAKSRILENKEYSVYWLPKAGIYLAAMVESKFIKVKKLSKAAKELVKTITKESKEEEVKKVTECLAKEFLDTKIKIYS